MKKVKISLTAIAFVLGISAAVAGKIRDGDGLFYVDVNGDPTGPQITSASCDADDSKNCARRFQLDDDGNPIASQPVGNFIKGNRL